MSTYENIIRHLQHLHINCYIINNHKYSSTHIYEYIGINLHIIYENKNTFPGSLITHKIQ